MLKVFISQPMRGLSDDEILRKRQEIINNISVIINDEFEVIDSFFESYPGEVNRKIPIWYLSKSIELISEADVAYFAKGWEKYRGCRIEYQVANEYGLVVLEE